MIHHGLKIPFSIGQAQGLVVLSESDYEIEVLSFVLKNRIEEGLVSEAVRGLIERYDALRLSIFLENNVFTQRVGSITECTESLPLIYERSAKQESYAGKSVKQFAEALAYKNVRIDSARPFFAVYIAHPQGDVMAWALHHLASDFFSAILLVKEFEARINVLPKVRNRLPPPPPSFTDYVHVLSRLGNSPHYKDEVAELLSLDWVGATDLPIDFPSMLGRAKVASIRTKKTNIKRGVASNASPLTLDVPKCCLFAFVYALCKHRPMSWLRIGVSHHGREFLEGVSFVRTVGYLAASHDVLFQNPGRLGWSDFASALNQQLDRYSNWGRALSIHRWLSSNFDHSAIGGPYPSLFFNFVGTNPTSLTSNSDFGHVEAINTLGFSDALDLRPWLTLQVSEESNDLSLLWEYNSELFEEATIMTLTRNVSAFLKGVLASSGI